MNTRTILALSLLLGLPACLQKGPPVIRDLLTRAPELSIENPANIAILEVENRTGSDVIKPLLEPMRAQLQAALIDRYYTPLNPTFVDAHMRIGARDAAAGGSTLSQDFLASLAGKAREDAILAVQVSRWDEASLLVDNRVRFEAQVVMLGSESKKLLWWGRVDGEVVAGGEGAAPRSPEARRKAAAVEFVNQLIERLPRRRA